MVEILVMLGVIGWFSKTASGQGKSGFLWGAIGAASYYGPVIIFGRFIFPEFVRGKVTAYNQYSYVLMDIAISVALGITCCFLAKRALLSSAPTEGHRNE